MAELLTVLHEQSAYSRPEPSPHRARVWDEHDVTSGDVLDPAGSADDDEGTFGEAGGARDAVPGAGARGAAYRGCRMADRLGPILSGS